MFSGKSEELIRRLTRTRIARQHVVCYKPNIDLRYHQTAITSHGAQTHEPASTPPCRASARISSRSPNASM